MKYIYKIECLVNHRVYIGQTNNLKRRIIEHKRHLKYHRHENKYLQEDYNNYGSSNFKFNLIETVNENDAEIRETYWIDKFGGINSNSTYNIESLHGRNELFKISISGERSSFYNKHHTEETKQKMRKAKQGMYLGENNPNYNNHKLAGKNHPNYGKKMSDEQKNKLRKAQTKYDQTFVNYIRTEHDKGVSFKALSQKLNIASSTLGRLYNYGTTSPSVINSIKLNNSATTNLDKGVG